MATDLLELEVACVALEGDGNLRFELRSAGGGALPGFEPGAHIDLHMGNGLVRQYSLSGSPRRSHRYELCVRLDSASRGGSKWMHSAVRPGQKLFASVPRNHFALPVASRHLLFAAGIGITPIIAMAETLAADDRPFELHYYVSRRTDVAFAERLDFPDMAGKVFIHVSEEGHSLRAGPPTVLRLADDATMVMTCGPAGFIATLEEQAIAHGWQAGQLRHERFSVDTSKVEGPRAAFMVEVASSGMRYAIPEHQSIAEVLLGAGVPLGLSCEQGICGSCLTRVLAGIPEHNDSVQSDAERAANSHMTLCCSRSRSDLLVLDL